MQILEKIQERETKILNKYLEPYEVVEINKNGIYHLKNIKTGKKLGKMVNLLHGFVVKLCKLHSFHMQHTTSVCPIVAPGQ